MKNTFHKKERLCSKKQMEWLFAKGTSKNSNPVKLIFIKNEEMTDGGVKAMFVVPKRKFKKAHDRNKLKRRMREAYRVSKAAFYTKLQPDPTALNMAFLYTGNKEEPYSVIYASVTKLLKILTEEIVPKSKD